jgi:hypothetical protein
MAALLPIKLDSSKSVVGYWSIFEPKVCAVLRFENAAKQKDKAANADFRSVFAAVKISVQRYVL